MTNLAQLVSSIPSPSANSIGLGPLDLNAYGLMIAFGVLAGTWLLGRQLEARGLGTPDDAGSIAMWGVGAGIVGARLYHVATDWERFSDNLGAIPKLWEGGLGIPGGLLAGVFVGIWQGQRRGIRPAQLLTCAAPAIPLAQAIGRWGNWFNQELFGRQTDLPWALEIDDQHLPAGYASGTTFHPTFLYESLWNLGLVGLLLWIDRKYRLGPGRLFAVYILGYGVGRYWIEGMRIDPARDVGGLRWNQWVALAAIVGGVVYLVATRGRRWPDEVENDEVADDEVADDEVADDEVADDEVADDEVENETRFATDADDHIDASPDGAALSLDGGTRDVGPPDAGDPDAEDPDAEDPDAEDLEPD